MHISDCLSSFLRSFLSLIISSFLSFNLPSFFLSVLSFFLNALLTDYSVQQFAWHSGLITHVQVNVWSVKIELQRQRIQDEACTCYLKPRGSLSYKMKIGNSTTTTVPKLEMAVSVASILASHKRGLGSIPCVGTWDSMCPQWVPTNISICSIERDLR